MTALVRRFAANWGTVHQSSVMTFLLYQPWDCSSAAWSALTAPHARELPPVAPKQRSRAAAWSCAYPEAPHTSYTQLPARRRLSCYASQATLPEVLAAARRRASLSTKGSGLSSPSSPPPSRPAEASSATLPIPSHLPSEFGFLT